MVGKSSGKKQYRSMRGRVIDLDKLRKRNELTLAVGNVKMNARGDEIGPGGKIIKKREEIIKEYYNTLPNEDPILKPRHNTIEETQNQVKSEEQKTSDTKKKSKLSEKETKEFNEMDDWVEDENGNFVKGKKD